MLLKITTCLPLFLGTTHEERENGEDVLWLLVHYDVIWFLGDVRLSWNAMTKGFHRRRLERSKGEGRKCEVRRTYPVDVDVLLEVELL
ncbi:hypothetical protein NDU88_006123 [Pleurodeles waltl]|uniref:Uncharacterized protein n=1 Tax=Pleurodeles waltl TaxID=8319 RepID=A0AAV7TW84_PLEWA|nr:hypothetical protein NDU88_006123 [Pleurodeles waltl]